MSKLKIAIQGVPGSFHHQVALRNFGEEIEIISFNTFEPVAKCIANGEADFAVMAIENSIAGAILPNYDLIDRYGLSIRDEYYLPIAHQFLALSGQTIEEIEEVRSHPMALLQCKAFFKKYPHIQLKEDIDTASVAKDIANKKLKGVAAIASKIAADIYGLEILAADVQTIKDNYTRFIILQKEPVAVVKAANKASIKVTIQNQKGGLARLLTLLAANNMDLSKIQSIPVIEKPWEYSFFIDLVFDDEQVFKNTIEEIRADFGAVKIFGEYVSRIK